MFRKSGYRLGTTITVVPNKVYPCPWATIINDHKLRWPKTRAQLWKWESEVKVWAGLCLHSEGSLRKPRCVAPGEGMYQQMVMYPHGEMLLHSTNEKDNAQQHRPVSATSR